MTSTSAPAQPSAVLSSLPARHPLMFYFLIAFGFSWLMFLPGLLMYYGVISLRPDVVRLIAIAGLLGPILSGFIMTALTEDGPGMARLLRRIMRWRVGLRWYVFAFFGLPAAMALATFMRPGALESFEISARPFVLAYLVPSSPWFSSEDHCSRSQAGLASRNLACSDCMVHCWEA
jgi:CAAX protease family protein